MYNDVYSISDGPRVNKKAHLISLKAVINNPILGFCLKMASTDADLASIKSINVPFKRYRP